MSLFITAAKAAGVDVGVGGSAITLPLWLHQFNPLESGPLPLLGLALVVLRIAVTWRDLRRRGGERGR
jgi:hypothetical protein